MTKSSTTHGKARRGLGWKSILLLSLLPFSAAVLFSVHDDGLFELGDGAVALTSGSGDILGSGAQPGCDWADLFPDSNPADDDFEARAAACGGITSLFIADDLSTAGLTDHTVYAQSNKNIDLVGTWNWDSGNNPPKDDLANVYAFAALNAADELIIYVGLERLAEDGDSHIDIEFNQATVGLDKDPACGSDGVPPDNDSDPTQNDGAPCEFTGEKTDEDLLLVMDFERGGALGLVRRFHWNDPDLTPGTGDETLDEVLPALGGQGCVAGDIICAVNNGGSIDGGPWPNFNRHGAVVANLPTNAFTEVGVNVSQTLGQTPCFGTIQVHSRSSQSVSSELKDFALHNFSICGIEIVKEGPGLSKIGDDVEYDFTITNTGGVELHLDSVIDDQIGDITADASAAGCDPLGPDASCNFSVSFTIPGGADDPFVNVVTAIYNSASDLSGAEISDDDDHSVNLFQPSVEILKDGDELSKIGDQVTYDFTINNTSSPDSPNLILDSIADTVLGDLAAAAGAAGCGSLAAGASCNFSVNYTIQAGDPDPLGNTVDVHYHPDGFPNDISDSDDHSVNLFQPSVDVTKTGDELSKVGDDVTYTIEVCNDGSADSPALEPESVVDSLLGDLSASYVLSLAVGECESHDFVRTVEAGDPDPLENTVEVLYHPAGFPNDIADSDDHSVNLFQPEVTVTKTGDELSKVGDDVTYTIEVCNTGSADSPALEPESVVDSLLGDLSASYALSLAVGECESHDFVRTVEAGDPDPLENTVEVLYHPAGFPNDITDSDDHSVNLFQPSVDIDKTGDELSKVGDFVDYLITVTNTSSADSPNLTCDITDALLGVAENVNLAPGASHDIHASREVQAGDPDPLINTASVTCTVDGFGNVIGPETDSHSVNLFQPSVDVTKTGDALSKVGDDVTYTIRVCNDGSADSPALEPESVVDSLLGDLSASYVLSLAVGECESHDFVRTVQAGDPDPLENTVSVLYHPAGFPNDIRDSDDHSVNLFQPSVEVVKNCGPEQVAPGETVTYNFLITNTSSADSPNLALDSVTDAGTGWAGLGDLTADAVAAGCGSLAPGANCAFSANRAVQAGDPNPLEDTVTVHYHPAGFPNDISASDSCSVEIVGCALSPGFWGGGAGVPKWDQAIDPIAAAAGFTTSTPFPWVDASIAPKTYLEVLGLSKGGDITIQLAFKYIAARLNEAAFGVPAPTAAVLDACDVYFAANPVGSDPQGAAQTEGQTLKNALDAYFATVGEAFCPLPSAIPEA